jgi:hypothetical protein
VTILNLSIGDIISSRVFLPGKSWDRGGMLLIQIRFCDLSTWLLDPRPRLRKISQGSGLAPKSITTAIYGMGDFQRRHTRKC